MDTHGGWIGENAGNDPDMSSASKTEAVRHDQTNATFPATNQKKSIMVSQQLFLGLQLLLEATAKSASLLRPNSTSHFKEVPDVGHGNAAKEWIIICVSNGHTNQAKASHLWGITRAMDLQSLPPLKSPFPKASHPPSLSLQETSADPPIPWSPTPPRGTFSCRPLAQPPCTLHILILINVKQVSPFWGLPSFSIPGFLLDLHNHMSFTPLVPSFCLQGERFFHGGRITLRPLRSK